MVIIFKQKNIICAMKTLCVFTNLSHVGTANLLVSPPLKISVNLRNLVASCTNFFLFSIIGLAVIAGAAILSFKAR